VEKTIDIDYVPQPKQRQLSLCPANEILYGGAAGPGKSHAIRYEALIWANRIPELQVYLFRRTYPELEKNHILPILLDWGEQYGQYYEQKKRYILPNNSMIHFCHAQHEKDVMLYHGAEIQLLVIDELSTFSEWQYVYLRNRVRSTLDIPAEYKHKIPGIIAGSNPGGPGHEFCKRCFVDFCRIDAQEAEQRRIDPSDHVYEHHGKDEQNITYYGLRLASDDEGGMVRAYIPGVLQDNPILMSKDPGYIKRVKAMPEPYRSAYLYGDWEIFIGQMFNFNSRDHVCVPHPIPPAAPLSFSFDWGFGKPFSCNWFYTDADNRIFLFTEWYGWTGVPDQGLRLTDSQVAEGIINHEKAAGLRTQEGGMVVDGFTCGVPKKRIEYILSPDCFSRKPDYKGGGQGPSTAEVFAKYGINGYPGDATRDQKIKQFHERLRVKEGEVPMFQVFDTCKQFIRTIPLLQQDENNPEEVDTKLEDHCFDAVALMFMSRPVSMELPRPKLLDTDKRILDLYHGDQNSYESYAAYEQEIEINRLQSDDEDYGGDYELISTVD
jgi:hypothetical protein